MDQATILGYALGYTATVIAAFLLFLPLLIGVVLLLLLSGVAQLVILTLKTVTLGIFRSLARMFRTPAGRLPHGRGGDRLVPH